VGIALANARLHVRERAISTELQAANATLTDTVSALQAWAGPSSPPVPYPKDPTGQRQEDLERAHRHQDAVRSKGRL